MISSVPTELPSDGDLLTRRRYWFLLAIVAITAGIYVPGLTGAFAFDDLPNIVDNVDVHVSTLSWSVWWSALFSSPASDLQRPLAMLTFAINHYFTGLDPFPMKVTNLIVHLVNVVLAYVLARSIFRATMTQGASAPPTTARIEGAALVAAGLWAVAPINLTPVLLVVQRMESLAQIFVFAGLCLYVKGRLKLMQGRAGWGQILTAIVACSCLGVLAKETAALLPLYAFILEVLIFRFVSKGTLPDRRFVVLYAAVLLAPFMAGAVWLVPKILSPGAYSGRDFSLSERLLTETRVVWEYVRWTIVPNLGSLSFYHDDYVVSKSLVVPTSTSIALVAWLGVLSLAFAVRRTNPVVALCLLWFMAAHLITASVIPLELVYEHRNYFASFSIFLLLAYVFVLTPIACRAALASSFAVLALIGFYAWTTYLRATEWGNPIRFALSEAAKHPSSPRATYDKGRMYVVLCNYDVHSPFFGLAKQALIDAAAVPGSTILPEQALLMLSARTGTRQDPAWWQSIEAKLKSRPVGVQEYAALYSLSHCQETGRCGFDIGNMLDVFYAAIGRNPSAEVLTVFGNYALNVLHDYDLALRLMHDAVARNPRTMQYHENLAKVLIFLRHFDEAKSEIGTMRALDRFLTSRTRIDELQGRLQRARVENLDDTGSP